MKKAKILLFSAVALAVGFLTAASVQAVPTTYQYTGNPFTRVNPPYTTSDFVTGTITLATPLGPNFNGDVSPIAYSFSDGVQTITTLPFPALFQFATGPTGNITQWLVAIRRTPGSFIDTRSDPEPFSGVFDVGLFGGAVGSNNGPPGAWSVPGGVADTGSTVLLMSLTLMALGVAARRFKPAAA